MIYELIDEQTTNTFASYAEEAAALAAWRALRDGGSGRAATLMLVTFDNDGMALAVTSAAELAALV